MEKKRGFALSVLVCFAALGFFVVSCGDGNDDHRWTPSEMRWVGYEDDVMFMELLFFEDFTYLMLDHVFKRGDPVEDGTWEREVVAGVETFTMTPGWIDLDHFFDLPSGFELDGSERSVGTVREEGIETILSVVFWDKPEETTELFLRH